MIKFITSLEVLPLRNEVLREGKLTLEKCVFPTDNLPGSFHLGFFVDEMLTSIVSFHPEKYGEYKGEGFQLRGMATLEQLRGKGLGNQLVNFALVYLKGKKANYIWCNARKTALNFYLNLGFEIISDQFEVPGIGPHHVMYLKIT